MSNSQLTWIKVDQLDVTYFIMSFYCSTCLGCYTPIFRSLRLLGVLLHRLYCAVMIEVYALIYLSSCKCYTYIMRHVWLWVSVFLQACGVLWLLNILACGVFWWCIMHMYWCLYVWACTYLAWGVQEHAHSEPHMTHNIDITLTTR